MNDDQTSSASPPQNLLNALSKFETALKIKTGLLSSISRGIRTPLTGIIGMTAMLAQTGLTQEQRELLNTIRTSSESLFSIVNDVLDYTRIEEHKLTLESLDFDVRAAIHDVLELVGVSASQKKINLRSVVADSVPSTMRGDLARLKQVLFNLTSKVIEFTESGSVSLSVFRIEPSDKLRFQVTSACLGTGREKLSSLAQSFTQADMSSCGDFGIAGIGFAICGRLIHLMGGEIEASSVPGEGISFSFTMHLSRAADQSPEKKRRSLAGREVLLVQRNAEERAATRSLLQEMNLLVTEAENAPQALSLCSQRGEAQCAFSFVLADSDLAVIDGIRFTRLFRAQHTRNLAAKIVLLTGTRLPDLLTEAKEAGAVDVLLKPPRHGELLRSFSQAAPQSVVPGKRGCEPAAALSSILVVEDNPVNQLVTTLSLQKLGYAVQTADDGFEALKAFASKHFDLILMDCHMPRMDGITATRKIRELGGPGETVPILALTADVFEAVRDNCIASGMNDFMSKPLRMDILKSKLDFWLHHAAEPPRET